MKFSTHLLFLTMHDTVLHVHVCTVCEKVYNISVHSPLSMYLIHVLLQRVEAASCETQQGEERNAIQGKRNLKLLLLLKVHAFTA